MAPVLVEYRVAGGPVGVDQRLTVFEDGRVQLDERHRTRAVLMSQIDAREVEELRNQLSALPARRWRRFPDLGRIGPPDWAPWRFPLPPSAARSWIRRGRRSISDRKADDPDVASLFDRLDAVRLRVLQDHPR